VSTHSFTRVELREVLFPCANLCRRQFCGRKEMGTRLVASGDVQKGSSFAQLSFLSSRTVIDSTFETSVCFQVLFLRLEALVDALSIVWVSVSAVDLVIVAELRRMTVSQG
jgi:hypothetical protein